MKEHGREMTRTLWPWALGGLIVPGIVWAAGIVGVEGSPADGLLLTFFYPTWLFVWLVMGIVQGGGGVELRRPTLSLGQRCWGMSRSSAQLGSSSIVYGISARSCVG